MTTTDPAASYQTLRGHLAYLKLTRAEEVLAAHLQAARAQQLSHVAFLEALLGEEVAATRQRRHRARLRFAHFPVEKHLADFDYDFQPTVDRALVAELATLAFLDAGTHALFMGPPGVGKTHLAIGLGHEVVAAGYRVYYTTAADLVAAMHAAFLEGTWTHKLRFYTAPSLLVVDELGYLPMDRRGAHALFQVVDRRNQAGNSICLTTNRSFASWGEIFEDDAVAAAILDRLLGNAVVINIRGVAYGSSALAIGEALVSGGTRRPLHVIIDPLQATVWSNVGWQMLRSAGLDAIARLVLQPSSIALPQLVAEPFTADAAFVDGSHRSTRYSSISISFARSFDLAESSFWTRWRDRPGDRTHPRPGGGGVQQARQAYRRFSLPEMALCGSENTGQRL